MFIQNQHEDFCSLCGAKGPFIPKRPQESLRETTCPQCKASRRTRDCALVLLYEVCGRKDIPLVQSLSKFIDCSILEFQAQGPLHDILKVLPLYQCTEFYKNIPVGSHYKGVLCQDLLNLTLASNQFDIVITQDIFEHLEDPWKGFQEVNRVLKRGGKHIFTVPIHDGCLTQYRARQETSGVVHLHPEVYHSDPLCPNGVLVYTDFGSDLIKQLQDRNFEASIAHSSIWYSPEEVSRVYLDNEYKRYVEYFKKGKAREFFHYNSFVFTIVNNDEPLDSKNYRIVFSDGTNSWQINSGWEQAVSTDDTISIQTIRGETINLYDRIHTMLDVVVGNNSGICGTIVMLEVCFGDFVTFIVPSIYSGVYNVVEKVAEGILSTLFRIAKDGGIPKNFCVNADGEAIDISSCKERMIPGLSSYYTLIPHLNRYAFVNEKIVDRLRVLDIGCGVGYGLVMVNPDEGLGFDISSDAIFYANSLYTSKNICWEQHSLEEAPTYRNYTTAICFENIEHLDDSNVLIDMLHDALVPDGCAFISIPNPMYHGVQYNHFHKRDFSFEQIQALLEDNFHEVEWFFQDDFGSDISQRFCITEGIKKNAQFWIAHCKRPRKNIRKACAVSIIMPVYNQCEYTKKAIEALKKNTPHSLNWELIIIDNASTDGTEEELFVYKDWIRIRKNEENLGFAKACNQGATIVRGDILVFLNNDTEVHEGWLEALLDELHKHPDTGVVGGKLLYPDGTIQHAGVAIGRDSIPKHMHRGCNADDPFVQERRIYPIVTAACMGVRRKEFIALGLFDEHFVNGHEDIDLCLRYKNQGQASVYRPDCVVTHYESMTAGRLDARDSNLKRTFQKHKESLIQDDFLYKTLETSRETRDPPLQFAIKIGTPSRIHSGWGDTYYAESLAKAICALGHKCVIHYLNEWGQEDTDIDIVIHLKGISEYHPKPWNINIMWMISHPELHTEKEDLEKYDALCVASESYADKLRAMVSIPVFFMPQATDPEHFTPHNDINKQYDLVFVGNNKGLGRESLRKTIRNLLPTKYSLGIWGNGWHTNVPDKYHINNFIEWEQLPEVYALARIVLNDHHPEMAANGFVNNRTFDALACGVLVVSDYIDGMKALLDVPQCHDAATLQETLDLYLNNPELSNDLVVRLRAEVLSKHTFIHRAQTLENLVQLLQEDATVTSRIANARKRVFDTVYRTTGPLVSVLMSTYSRHAYLNKSIQSILNQTYQNWELCLVCDGGKPVNAIVEQYNDPRIHLIHLDTNQGKGNAINKAFSHAQGEYIAYLDDDDIWYPDHLERSMIPLRELQDIQLAYSNIYTVVLDVKNSNCAIEVDRELYYDEQVTLGSILEFNKIHGIAVVHHRSLFTVAGGFDPKLKVLIDFDMWRRLLANAYPYHVSITTGEHYLYSGICLGERQITSLAQTNPLEYHIQRMRILHKPLRLEEQLIGIYQMVKAWSVFAYGLKRSQDLWNRKEVKKANIFLKLAEQIYHKKLSQMECNTIELERLRALHYLERRNTKKALKIFEKYVGEDGTTCTDIFYMLFVALELRDSNAAQRALSFLYELERALSGNSKDLFDEYVAKAVAVFGPEILEGLSHSSSKESE